MRYCKRVSVLVILLSGLAAATYAQDHDLRFFLGKASSKDAVLSKNERMELLNRIEKVLEEAQRTRETLARGIQSGEIDVRYQDGTFWLSELEKDGTSIEKSTQQIKLLKEKLAKCNRRFIPV